MTKYEQLLDEVAKEDIDVVETYFDSDAKGLCIDNLIAINNNLSEDEKACVLAEELGHYRLSTGNIINQSNTNNIKQESDARRWAVNKLISVEDLIKAVKNGCTSIFEISEYLNLSEDFIKESINIFKAKYGACYKSDGYTIYFNDLGFYIK